METPAKRLSPEAFQAQYGLEPTMVANLVASQAAILRETGRDLDLERVYALEVDQPEDQEEED